MRVYVFVCVCVYLCVFENRASPTALLLTPCVVCGRGVRFCVLLGVWVGWMDAFIFLISVGSC